MSLKITYNGNVIATIIDGQIATLKCAGKKMIGNIVITYAGEEESVNLITFTISNAPLTESTQYWAENDMTWGEWCNSKYNTDNYFVEGTSIVKVISGSSVVNEELSSVRDTDYIISEHKYRHDHVGGSN